jgi:hypothetical protein
MLISTGTLVLTMQVLQAASVIHSPNLQKTVIYPTDYPPDKQTLESYARETQQAGALFSNPTGTIWYFPAITNTPFPVPTLASTLAGAGVIFDDGDDSIGKLLGVRYISVWYAIIDGKRIQVAAGSIYNDNKDESQGAVYVLISIPGKDRLPDGGLYKTPDRSGALQIIGGQGERLILRSTGGKIYYFDIPGERFTASLSDVVPTATLWPITPEPSLTPTLNGDTAHNPIDVDGLSPIDTPLNFIIGYAGGEHWFRFRLATPSTIRVHLDNLPANYDLYVYAVSNVGFDGQSTNLGKMSELLTIENAPVDDYMVRVVSVNGAFDPVHPYQLEFDVVAANAPSLTPSMSATS